MFRDEKLSETESLTCIANNIIENLQMYLIYFIYLFIFFFPPDTNVNKFLLKYFYLNFSSILKK